MPSISFTPAVDVITGIAIFLTLLSIYISRAYLPAKIKGAYLKSITVLAAAVETKDSGTVGHAQRVARLSVAVAGQLGVTGHELERLEYAALLRDIGKATVPLSLLISTEPLSPKERAILQSHSAMGAEMVEAVPFLADTGPYIRHHHEHWDGSGYPDGLKGEDIPLASRILTVASDYDAMVSERPYHTVPLEHEKALEEIQQASGVKYDPKVVEVFLKVCIQENADAAS